jgi:peptidoglycan/LPS O-acetylase OafA/YrhL
VSSAAVADIAPDPRATSLTHAIPAARLEALTGLRFYAAFCILFAHACEWLAPFRDSNAIARVGGAFGIYGMPLFFVLSGFVIQYNYGRLFESMRFRWAALVFVGARFAWLYPLFICFFAVGLIVDVTLGWLSHHPHWWVLMVLHYITMSQSWFYMVIFSDRMIMSNAFGLAWSISTEFFFYICFLGLVFFILRVKKWSHCVMVMTVFSIVILAMLIKLQSHRHDVELHAQQFLPDFLTMEQKWSESFIRWLFYYSPYFRIFEFILGCLTARLYMLMADRPISAREAVMGKIALLLALIWLLAFGLGYTFHRLSGNAGEMIGFLSLNFGLAPPIAVTIFCVSRFGSKLVDVSRQRDLGRARRDQLFDLRRTYLDLADFHPRLSL